ASDSTLLTVLSIVLGLFVNLHTTSAYGRYRECRNLWTTIELASRNLAGIIWAHVPTDRSATSKTPLPQDAKLKTTIEKRSMINLVQAFSASTKHYLRGETGVYYEDLYPLIAFLPQYANINPEIEHIPLDTQGSGSDDTTAHGKRRYRKPTDTFHPELALPSATPDHIQLAPKRLAPELSFLNFISAPSSLKALYNFFGRKVSNIGDGPSMGKNAWTGKRAVRPVVESVVPLEITLHLSSYYNFLLTEGLLQPAAATSFNNNLHFLQDASVQLRLIATAPIMYGENDLDIDSYCLSIAREIAEITAHDPIIPSEYTFSPSNQPFAPADKRTTSDLTTDMEHD
ncbi:hypothetical protein FRC11_008716, partial [Ceratobasidium sp. 423]